MDFLRAVKKAPAEVLSPEHPYYPLNAEIAGFIANDKSALLLLSTFAAILVVISSVAVLLAKRINGRLTSADTWALNWFILCGSIHMFLEGYYSYNYATIGGNTDLVAQMWKEYAYSDSRYLTQDAFVMCMESITAFLWGPLSYVLVVLILKEHPLRYPLQAVVSLGQLYGDFLYYATSQFDHFVLNKSYWRPEPYYFWCYYFTLNMFWVVIPGYLLYQSMRESTRAFKAVGRVSKTLKTNEPLSANKTGKKSE